MTAKSGPGHEYYHECACYDDHPIQVHIRKRCVITGCMALANVSGYLVGIKVNIPCFNTEWLITWFCECSQPMKCEDFFGGY